VPAVSSSAHVMQLPSERVDRGCLCVFGQGKVLEQSGTDVHGGRVAVHLSDGNGSLGQGEQYLLAGEGFCSPGVVHDAFIIRLDLLSGKWGALRRLCYLTKVIARTIAWPARSQYIERPWRVG
jgi:hypothetical protein